MPEDVLFSSEHSLARHEIAAYLHELAEKLEDDGAVSLRSADQSIELSIPDEAVLEVEVEDEGRERSLELEIEWDRDGGAGSDLTVA